MGCAPALAAGRTVQTDTTMNIRPEIMRRESSFVGDREDRLEEDRKLTNIQRKGRTTIAPLVCPPLHRSVSLRQFSNQYFSLSSSTRKLADHAPSENRTPAEP